MVLAETNGHQVNERRIHRARSCFVQPETDAEWREARRMGMARNRRKERVDRFFLHTHVSRRMHSFDVYSDPHLLTVVFLNACA